MTLGTLNNFSCLGLLLVALPLAACGGPDKDDTGPEGDTDTDTDTDTDSDSDADTDTDTDTDASGTFGGTVLFEDDSVGSGEVQLCSSFCMIGELDADGSFLFTSLPTDRYGLHVELGEDIAEGLFFFDVVSAEDATLTKPFYGVEWQTETEVPEGDTQTVSIGTDMYLAVDTDTLQLPLGTSDYVIKGATVESAYWPDLDTIDGTVVGMWIIGPFNGTFDPPASFSITDDFGLEEGAQRLALVALAHHREVVLDRLGGRDLEVHGDFLGVDEEGVGQAPDLGRHGGREEQGLPDG